MSKEEITLGVDIGGTTTSLGFVDREGDCLSEATIPTNAEEAPQYLIARIHVTMKEELEKLSRKYELVGIGIGAPNANYYRGTVEHPPNLNWEGITNMVELMREYQDLPVAITNDANAAAIGELKFGAGKGMKHFIVITLGTGLGSGIVVNGDLLYGHDGFAGELGHTTVDPEGRHCACGKRGCLETYASATGLCRTVFELLCKRLDESSLRGVSFDDLTSRLIYEAAMKGDPIALEAFQQTGRILGIKLADAIAHFSPEAIILFGGLAQAKSLIFEPTRRAMDEYTFVTFKGKVKLLPSALKETNAAVLGAGALIWNEIEKKR